MTNSLLVDVFGYVALALNLYSMAVKGESKLRIISALAHVLCIIYGTLLHAYPIVIGASLAVILHTYRLHNMKNEITQRKI